MKSLFFVFCLLLSILSGSFELSAACNPYRTYTTNSSKRTGKNTTTSAASSTKRSRSFRGLKIEALRKKEKALLSDVQRLQTILCLRRDKLSNKQKEKLEKKLWKKLDYFQKSTGQLKDFPFQDKMRSFNELISDIQSGKVLWEGCKGQKEQYIIRKLHRAQLTSLLRSYSDRELD